MSAKQDLLEFLIEGECVEAIVFGAYGWDGFNEDKIKDPLPQEKIGVILNWEEAQKLMETWSFNGGYGSPDCYACYIWTDSRVIWVTQYDGSTCLNSAPRNPVDGVPGMSGG